MRLAAPVVFRSHEPTRAGAVFVVVAGIEAKPGHGDELEGMFRDIVEWVADNEPGTSSDTRCRSTDDRDEEIAATG